MSWSEVRQEAAGHLQRMIRFNTVNPPGNELPLALQLRDTLAGAGIDTVLLEPAPERAAVIARLPGSGERRPVVLLAHMDVVGVEPERWSVDPFAGEIRDDYIYGRGAIDDKGMLATNVMTMLLLRRALAAGLEPLRRDVIFVATSDEEAGGTWGIEWLIEHHPALVTGEFALNEGGRIRLVDGRPLYAAIQTAEKVSHIVAVTARGPSGHASVPLADNAVARLARALTAIAAHREPVMLLPSTRRFFAGLAAAWPDRRVAAAMADVASGDAGRAQRGAAALAVLPRFDALLRSGVSPTILQAGLQANVIPAEARATLNIRTLPGESVQAVIARLRGAADGQEIEFTVTASGRDAPESDSDSAMFTALRDTLRELDPTIVTVPYLSTGATDSAYLRAWGMQAFGLLPFPLDEADEKRMHGHDERLSLAALEFGVRLTLGTIRRVAG